LAVPAALSQAGHKFLRDFHGPGGGLFRLIVDMRLINETPACGVWPAGLLSSLSQKEPKLKLTMQIRANENEDVTVVYCQGRLVYRDEAAAATARISELIAHHRLIVLDLSEVQAIDGAGLGQLVILHMRAQQSDCMIKLAAPSARVRELLELTNLDSVLETHPTVEEAILSSRAQMV
jgi:anti-sigma B factor antagonist